ncbi:hypothetical protein J6590_011500 [Homalodisca vitripennis]|nr:hypothetical protein J6590_011500 [Homalodisca vitripennis]
MKSIVGGVLAVRDNVPEDPNNRPPSSPHSHVYSPFIDELPEDISLVNTQPSLTNENRYEPYSFHPYRLRTVRQAWVPPFQFPSEVVVPLNDFNLDEALFEVYARDIKHNLDTLRERENLLIKYVECACPNKGNCQKPTEIYDDDDLKTSEYWSWGFGNQYPEVVRMDEFQNAMSALKLVVEKMILRQNKLYEYVSCSCTMDKECSSTVKPVLQAMFANSSNESREIMVNMFSSAESPRERDYFNNFMSIFAQRPNFNWLSAFNSFNPLSSFFGANPFGGTSAWPFPLVFNPITNSNPFGNFWNNFNSNKPSHSSGSVYTSGTGTGGSVTVSSGGPGGSSKPSGEHYTINSPGGTTHVSSSTDGAGSSSVSVMSSSGIPGGPSKPSGEHYTINSAGGTTHVSSSTDGAGGSSVSVMSSSGKSSRNIVYNRLGIDDQTFNNLHVDPYKIEDNVLKEVENGKEQIAEGEKFLGVQGLNNVLFRTGRNV